jgi:hypothetical protein
LTRQRLYRLVISSLPGIAGVFNACKIAILQQCQDPVPFVIMPNDSHPRSFRILDHFNVRWQTKTSSMESAIGPFLSRLNLPFPFESAPAIRARFDAGEPQAALPARLTGNTINYFPQLFHAFLRICKHFAAQHLT